MAKALQCDNCGQYFGYKGRNGKLNHEITEANTLAFCLSDEDGLLHIENYDICHDCLKKLFIALSGLVEKEGRK